MGSINLYLENKLTDHWLGGPAFTRPVSIYLALFTSIGADGEGGVEVVGVNYTRREVVNEAINWPAAVGGSKSLAVAHGWLEAGSNWGTVVAVVFFDAPAGGNRLAWDDFTGVPITTGIRVTYGINGLVVTQD